MIFVMVEWDANIIAWTNKTKCMFAESVKIFLGSFKIIILFRECNNILRIILLLYLEQLLTKRFPI